MMEFDLNNIQYPHLKAVYEVVDSTSDEMYYTLGVFTDAGQAIKEIESSTLDGLDFYDSRSSGFFTVEIRKRMIGWCIEHKIIYSCSWEESFNTELDDIEWKVTEKINKCQ